MASTSVGDTSLTSVAAKGVPPLSTKSTLVACDKLVPVIVTTVAPEPGPEVGEMLVTLGAGLVFAKDAEAPARLAEAAIPSVRRPAPKAVVNRFMPPLPDATPPVTVWPP